MPRLSHLSVLLSAALVVLPATALAQSGVYTVKATFSGMPFFPGSFENTMVANATLNSSGTWFSTFDVTEFTINGESFLGKQSQFLIENLSGNGRFRATFRNQAIGTDPSETFEVFYRFVVSSGGATEGPIVAIFSSASASRSVSTTGTATFDTGPIAPVPEPGTLALSLAGLGVVGWAARRRRS